MTTNQNKEKDDSRRRLTFPLIEDSEPKLTEPAMMTDPVKQKLLNQARLTLCDLSTRLDQEEGPNKGLYVIILSSAICNINLVTEAIEEERKAEEAKIKSQLMYDQFRDQAHKNFLKREEGNDTGSKPTNW